MKPETLQEDAAFAHCARSFEFGGLGLRFPIRIPTPAMGEANQAVLLSNALQDADAARRICEALPLRILSLFAAKMAAAQFSPI